MRVLDLSSEGIATATLVHNLLFCKSVLTPSKLNPLLSLTPEGEVSNCDDKVEDDEFDDDDDKVDDNMFDGDDNLLFVDFFFVRYLSSNFKRFAFLVDFVGDGDFFGFFDGKLANDHSTSLHMSWTRFWPLNNSPTAVKIAGDFVAPATAACLPVEVSYKHGICKFTLVFVKGLYTFLDNTK